MRFAERLATRYWRTVALVAFALLPLGLGSCASGFEPLSAAPVVEGLVVTPVRVNAVRLTWPTLGSVDVVSYVVERRVDLTGAFTQVAQLPRPTLDTLVWLDTDVRPETFYGYRVRSVTAVGDRSRPSTVGGALTPPLPGIDVTTATFATVAAAFDPDGYEVVIAGPDTMRAVIGTAAKQRFSPLRSGPYVVRLQGLISRCEASPAQQVVMVSDTVAATIVIVPFEIRCADPNRGEILVTLNLTGAALDPSLVIDVLGEAADTTLPPVDRTYSSRQTMSSTFRSARFGNLRPGTYDVRISDIASNCTLQGASTRTVTVVARGEIGMAFGVNCVGLTPPVDLSKPFILRNRYAPAAAAPGGSVLLVSELDLSARPTWSVVGIQADYFYDATILRYDSTNVARLPQLTVNANTPGRISVLAASTTPRTGTVKLLEFAFTVIGSAGATSESNTLNFKASSRVSSTTVAFADSVRIEEDTFTVGTGSAVNAPPTATAGGPYTSTVGVPLSLTSAGSSDSDGTITSSAWSFGDGTSGTGTTVTKSYAAAGTFPVTLTVTDDKGATATAQTTATVTAAAGGNVPPVAQANGPYAATAGVPFSLSSVGSSDPNGTIVTYSWALGNGQTVTGQTPSVTYAVAGTYTVTLTVTDNGGLTSSAQATVTVGAGAGTGNLIWNTTFGAFDAGNNWVPLTLSLNLATNLVETPGTEAVRTFVIDTIRWDPTRFQLVSVNLGPGIMGTTNQSLVTQGKLSLAGSVATANQTGDLFGLLTFATVRLRPIGAAGSVSTTQTFLGPVQGPASTFFFVYNPRITVVEGSFTRP